MTEPDKEERHRIVDEFMSYAKAGYAEVSEHYAAADRKADRYLTILVAVLAASTFAFDQLLDILAEPEQPQHWPFLLVTLLFYGAAIWGAFACLSAMREREIPAPGLGEDAIKTFSGHYSYEASVRKAATDILKTAATIRKHANQKYAAARCASRLLGAVLVFGALAALSYAPVRAWEVRMERDQHEQGGGSSQDQGQSQSDRPAQSDQPPGVGQETVIREEGGGREKR